MNENPLVTVNILSFNRKDELRNTLTKVYEQDYKNIEVIVVDNASSDGSPEMVEKEFAEVQLIRLEKNIGIAGWNEGFKVAKGEYILVLDDDSYPELSTISGGVDYLLRLKDCGVLGFAVYNLQTNKCETTGIDKSNPITFIGCGAIISKKVVKITGGFSKKLFLYEHEIEFSMRVQNIGYKIYFFDQFRIIHNSSSVNRNFNSSKTVDYRRQFYVIHNILYIMFIHFYLRKTAVRMARIIIGRLYFAALNGYFLIALKATLSFLIKVPKYLLQRELLSKNVQEIYGYGSYAGGFFFESSQKEKIKGYFQKKNIKKITCI